MMDSTPSHASERSRHTVHRVLVSGLAAATALMLAGVIVKLAAGDHTDTATRVIGSTGHQSAGDNLMIAGIVTLAATPALRVCMLIGWWIRERDWRFVLIALAVITTLALGVAAGGI